MGRVARKKRPARKRKPARARKSSRRGVKIRRLTAKDAPRIHRVEVEIFEPSHRASLAEIERRLESGKVEATGAEHDGELVGCVSGGRINILALVEHLIDPLLSVDTPGLFVPSGSEYLCLSLGVLEEFRKHHEDGKMAVSSMLLLEMLKRLRADGVTDIYAQLISPDGVRAFQDRMGFDRVVAYEPGGDHPHVIARYDLQADKTGKIEKILEDF